MKGTNAAVFVLFFGMALLEAFQDRNWIKALVWLAVGVVFLLSGSVSGKTREGRD